MGKIGKISSIKKTYDHSSSQTLAGSLAAQGLYRIPGTGERMIPWKEKNGKYRTGLDENALYIQAIRKVNPEEADQESARVKELRERLEAETKLDLSSTSEYYSKMFDNKFRSPERARIVKLKDGVNVFNLEDPYDLITYSWLRVHGDVAPSYQAWAEGKVKNAGDIRFFVDDEEYETEVAFKEKTLINKASSDLDIMSVEKQFKVARLLGLPVRFDDNQRVVYNMIDDYIKSTDNKTGNKLAHVILFNKIITMSNENLNVRFIIEEALKYNIYRAKSLGNIYEGDTMMAKDKEELIQKLSMSSNQEELLALEEKIRQRKLQEV